jgi:hypothetical protein
MADARDMAMATKEQMLETVRAVQAEKGHPDCAMGIVDAEFGVVCGCGTILREVEGLPPAPALDSQTTADAREAKPIVPEPSDRLVTTRSDIASAVDPADPIISQVQVIDPTAIYDSKMVEEHILDVIRRLEQGAHYQRVCEENVYHAKLELEKARARAMLEAYEQGGAADVRAARVMLATEVEHTIHMVAEMKLMAIRQTMHSLRSMLSGYQSVARSLQSAYSGAGRPAF